MRFRGRTPEGLPLARGEVNVDVYALERTSPPNVVIVECKNWAAAVNKNVVHAFRSVVGDSGANIGLLVSAGGFHSGAHEAAQYTNVRLLDWAGFQRTYVERWYRTFFGDRLRDEANPLIEYTEPINSRIARKENALPEDRRTQAYELRVRYWPLAMAIDHLRVPFLFAPFGGSLDLPSLPPAARRVRGCRGRSTA